MTQNATAIVCEFRRVTIKRADSRVKDLSSNIDKPLVNSMQRVVNTESSKMNGEMKSSQTAERAVEVAVDREHSRREHDSLTESDSWLPPLSDNVTGPH